MSPPIRESVYNSFMLLTGANQPTPRTLESTNADRSSGALPSQLTLYAGQLQDFMLSKVSTIGQQGIRQGMDLQALLLQQPS